MTWETLEVERDGNVATLWLNRPELLNAVNRQMIADLSDALAQLRTDESISCVVLRGRGRGFSGGGDIENIPPVTEVLHNDPVKYLQDEMDEHPRVMDILEFYDKPIIAAIHGPAVGVGFEICLACDYRLARADSKVGLPMRQLGLSPLYALALLPQHTSPGTARVMALTGQIIGSDEALDAGLVDEVVAEGAFEQRVGELATQLADVPIQVTMTVKRAMNRPIVEETNRIIDSVTYAEYWLKSMPAHEQMFDEVWSRVKKGAGESKGHP